jgi:hypothetical protein
LSAVKIKDEGPLPQAVYLPIGWWELVPADILKSPFEKSAGPNAQSANHLAIFPKNPPTRPQDNLGSGNFIYSHGAIPCK